MTWTAEDQFQVPGIQRHRRAETLTQISLILAPAAGDHSHPGLGLELLPVTRLLSEISPWGSEYSPPHFSGTPLKVPTDFSKFQEQDRQWGKPCPLESGLCYSRPHLFPPALALTDPLKPHQRKGQSRKRQHELIETTTDSAERQNRP